MSVVCTIVIVTSAFVQRNKWESSVKVQEWQQKVNKIKKRRKGNQNNFSKEIASVYNSYSNKIKLSNNNEVRMKIK